MYSAPRKVLSFAFNTRNEFGPIIITKNRPLLRLGKMARYLVSDSLQEFLNRFAKRTGEKLSKRPESDKQNSQINLQALEFSAQGK